MVPSGARVVCVLVIAAAATAGCTSGASASDSARAGAPAQGGRQPAAQSAPAKPLPTVCDRRVVTVDDVSDLLAGPIAPKPLPGDPQSCVFEGADFTSITFSVRPGLGDVSVGAWTSGKMPVSGTPVDGIGDKAVWQDTLRELIATKRNVLCDIQATGATGSTADVQKKFAALCGRIWAAQ